MVNKIRRDYSAFKLLEFKCLLILLGSFDEANNVGEPWPAMVHSMVALAG